jgi:hypothetical protein
MDCKGQALSGVGQPLSDMCSYVKQAPLCRRHHQAKQAYGWQLIQDQPGIMTWRTPHGRIYTTTPEPHPS